MVTARDRPPEEAAIDTSLARGLRLLLTVADRGEVRADDLAVDPRDAGLDRVPLPADAGQSGSWTSGAGSYALGPRLVIGGGSTVTSERLIRHADPVLRMLVDETGETALVVRRVGLAAVCLVQVETDQVLRRVHPGGAGDAAPRRCRGADAPGLRARGAPRRGHRAGPVRGGRGHRRRAARCVERDRRCRIATSGDEQADGLVSMAVPIMREDGIVARSWSPDLRPAADWPGERAPGERSSPARRPCRAPSTRRSPRNLTPREGLVLDTAKTCGYRDGDAVWSRRWTRPGSSSIG